ncbi:FAD-dependent oxidoreductase, partial [Streptomyces yerevanensis]|uniref:FAD-dependent oxidoreductase n=1 Tax=Streptomyces yerevanensis TaxID=66378 RepID=UPI000526E036
LDRTVQPEELQIYADLIGRYLPDLHPDPTRLSVYMEGYTESSRPLVGPLPGAENVILLAGFSGHGFKLSPAFGDIATDLALDGASPQPIDFLSTVGRTEA